MASHLWQIDIDCDAPPYPIINSCELLGFCKPWDVRWCCLRNQLSGQGGWLSRLWGQLRGQPRPSPPTCICGWWLPPTVPYIITFMSGSEAEYLLGQCPRCHTIFWENSRAPRHYAF